MNYINIDFYNDLKKEYHKYSHLSYSIDEDTENSCFELYIHSSSSSELDGSEEGTLQSYTYASEQDAREDMKQAEINFPTINWDEI